MVYSIESTYGRKSVTSAEASLYPKKPESTETGGNNKRFSLFSDHWVGVISSIGIGDYQDGQIQAGRPLGGTTLGVG